MANVLVSGTPEGVSEVAAALRTLGATVTEVTDLDQVPAVATAAGPEAFDGYVQLPSTFAPRGDSAIERVHHFFADGVLARFPALAAVVPAFTSKARVTFVLGVLPAEAATADDRAARQALVRVLGHATRADCAEAELAIRVLDTGSTAEEIASVALGRDRDHAADTLAQLDDTSYADWRVELLGLASMQT